MVRTASMAPGCATEVSVTSRRIRDAPRFGHDLRAPTALIATTTYAWDDPNPPADGLLVATTSIRARLTPDQAADLDRDLRAKARAAATERRLQDWSYEFHDQGRKRAS